MISAISLSAYVVFGIFVFYQQLHVKNFNGGSASFRLALNIFAFAGMATSLVFLGFCLLKFKWWTPIVVFFIGLVMQILAPFLERIASPLALSLAGFVVWPIAAYAMFAFA